MSRAQGKVTEMSMTEMVGEDNAKLIASNESSEKQENPSDTTNIGRDVKKEHQPKVLSKVSSTTILTMSQPMELVPKHTDLADTVHQLSQKIRKQEKAYEALLADFKEIKRDNRDQSLDLRELKKQNALLQEVKKQNAQLQARNEMTDNQREQIRRERQDLIEQIHLQEDVICQFKSDAHKRKSHMESLTIQTREANEEKANLELVNQKLARQNRVLSENLTECKDDLLRLQPPSQISDSEISEQYSNFHQHISRWVDDETEDSQMLEHRFDAIAINNDDLPEILRKYIRNDHLRLAKKYPSAQPLILRSVVQRYLSECIFGEEIYLFGLDSRTTEMLKRIEHGMERLEPQRDAVTVRHWRSETLKAILQLDEFRDEQRMQAVHISQSLHKSLSYLLPEFEGKKEGWKELHDQLVFPAVQASVSIRLSTTNYRITSRIMKSDQNTAVYVYEVPSYEMMDIMSHKIIRPDSIIKVADDGRIGEQILVIQPALLRDQKEGNGSVLLCKPTVLIRLDEPMGRRNRSAIKGITSWLKGETTD